ncbi:MAG: InlB B-repeat-containing protein [Clostridia bacterium]|nr:InlB B-repeat-containing protein [Clostridia bacterium]
MFSSYYNKIVSVILSFAVMLSLFILPSSASIKPNYSAYEYGDAYKSSNYYDQLLEAKSKLTGDHRYDVILIALSQVGYHEGDSDADMDGWNLGGSENFVEYNRLFCKLEGIWGYAWCAAFVSWCQFQAGIPAEIDCSEVSCPRMINEILKPQGLYKTCESGYTPIIGDLIYFKNATSNAVSTHVGLVIGVRDGYVYTVEGNGGERVARHKYALDDSYIVGYGALKYETKEGTDYSVFSLEEDSAKPGKFVVTADSLNVRAGAGTSFSILGALKHGDEVEVLKFNENWGKIDFKGKEGWISASYLRSSEVNVFTIYYKVGEGKMKLTQQRRFHDKEAVITDEVPTLEGNTFLGWATEKGGEVVYTAGASYTADEDITLYAVWDPAILTVTFADYDGSVLKTVEYPYGSKVDEPKDINPTRESDGEFAYEFAGWDEKMTWYIKRDMTYTATYTSRALTAEEKEQYIAAQATEALTEAPAESGCGVAVSFLPIILLFTPIFIKRKK